MEIINKSKNLIDKLYLESTLLKEELLFLLENNTPEINQYLFIKANKKRCEVYNKNIYMRGLIEFTNYCKRNCLYCGIRSDNLNAKRYRLTVDEILCACDEGYNLGFKTFVLQGGEDSYFTDKRIINIITLIKKKYPDCAITLSIGEKSKTSYLKYFNSGADRYLLRQETVSKELYKKLHPNMQLKNRIKCLYDLKEIGYQVGAGFLVGLPEQTNNDFVEDIFFLKEFKPHMVGIGPFIPHSDTPLSLSVAGTSEKTIMLIALIRLFLPKALIPATTALGSIDPIGREKGIMAGANVVMPNLSPLEIRNKYKLYDGKICLEDEPSKCKYCIEQKIKTLGFQVDMSRGDHIDARIIY